MDSNIQDRLQAAIDAICGGNKSEFCRRIGRDVSSLKDVIGGKISFSSTRKQKKTDSWIKYQLSV